MLKIKDLEHPLKELPLLPTVVSRLVSMDRDSDDYFDEVLELACEDPTFAVRIINLSNSAHSSPVRPITKLRDAVARMGADQIAKLVSSMHVARVFFPSHDGEKALWVHAVQVAVGAREIAKSVPALKIDPQEAYLCGLLHDIGRFVVFEKAVDDLKAVDEHNWTSPAQLVEIETKTYGFDHSELGWKLCQKWGVPNRIGMLVKNHHQMDLPMEVKIDEGLARLINVVQIADFFSVFMMLNPDFQKMPERQLEAQLEQKCIYPSCMRSPITPRQLLNLAKPILKESDEVVDKLGIFPKKCAVA